MTVRLSDCLKEIFKSHNNFGLIIGYFCKSCVTLTADSLLENSFDELTGENASWSCYLMYGTVINGRKHITIFLNQ